MTHPLLQPFELLPSVYRLRDAEQRDVLRAWFEVLSREIQIIEQDIDGLYQNQFIETCDAWVVPYCGELVGIRRPGSGDPYNAGEDSARLANRQRLVFPKAEVARAVEFAKRKGTAPVLEELARTVAGWPARAVEFYELASQFQAVHCPDPRLGRTVDVRQRDELDRVDGPCDGLGHTTDVRELKSFGVAGRYHISHVGLFVWRLPVYSLTETDARCLRRSCCDSSLTLYSFDPLGIPGPLFIKPVPETDVVHIANEHNVPAPLRREALRASNTDPPQASDTYYGRQKSLAVYIHDDGFGGAGDGGFVPQRNVIPFDLSIFRDRCACKGRTVSRCKPCSCDCKEKKRVLGKLEQLLGSNKVAVDPECGLLATAGYWRDVRVSYHYAFSADLGGGEYRRSFSPQYSPQTFIKRIRQPSGVDSGGSADQLKPVLDELFVEEGEARQGRKLLRHAHTILEIADSRVYRLQPVTLSLDSGRTFEIRAAHGCRPVIRIEQDVCEPGLIVELASGSEFVLDGLVLADGTLRIGHWAGGWQLPPGENACEKRPSCEDTRIEEPARPRVVIRHSTLVPCQTSYCGSAGLEIDLPNGCVTLQSTISSDIRNPLRRDDAGLTAPTQVTVLDSIIDGQASGHSITGAESIVLEIKRSTCFGDVSVRSIELAEDSIFTASVRVIRRNEGAMRFCFVRPDDPCPDRTEVPCWSTPRQYYCQPALEYQREAAATTCSGGASDADSEAMCEPAASSRQGTPAAKLQPTFTSRCYGEPGYAQLAHDCPDEIRRGAEDQSELGALHDLYLPQRDANLRERLVEFSPFSMNTTIIYAN